MKILVILFAVVPIVSLNGQQLTGAITGVTTDTSGAVIPRVALKLVSESTGASRESRSGKEGEFEFTAVRAGMYRLEAVHPGFKKYTASGIELTANQSIALGGIKLAPGEVSSSVTVQADAGSQVQTASGERSGIVTSEQIRDLTVINRDFATLVALMPGVVDSPGTAEVQGFSGGASFNINGMRSNGNNITIDGASTDNTNGGNGNNFVSLDSIQAVRIVTSNYQAEFGRKPAAAIMAITKGGSNQYHGSSYYYYRHEWMNANQFFNNRQGLPQTPRRVRTPGFTIGGPAFLPGLTSRSRTRVFFFAGLEFINERRPQSVINLTTPTALERSGDFSQTRNGASPALIRDPLTGAVCNASNSAGCFPGARIPASRIEPSGRALLALLPLPNATNSGITNGTFNFSTQESLNIPKISTSQRLDLVLDEKTSLWVKYNAWREDQKGWAVSAGNSNWGWMPSHYLNGTHAPVLAGTRILNRSTILEFSTRMTRWTEDGTPLDNADLDRLNRTKAGFAVPQIYAGGNPLNLVPNMTFGGGGVSSPIGTSLNARFPLRGAETTFFTDVTVTKTYGPHTTKFGYYNEFWRAIKGESGVWNGTYDFTVDSANPGDTNHPFANALVGSFKSYRESNTRPPLYENTVSHEWYVQDNWKIHRRLTLDFGMRFGWSTPFYSPRRQEAGFVPALWDPSRAVQFISPARVNNTRVGRDPSTGNIYPAILIGAIAPGSGDPFDGTVNLMTNLSYPRGLRTNSGPKAAPRFGFAFDPFGDGKTAIRGGFGLFYEIHEKDLWGYGLHLDPPNQLTPTINYGTFASIAASQGFQFPSATSGLSANRVLGRTMSMSFGIQRSLPGKTLLDVSYVGTLGRHLLERKDLNSIPAGTTLDPANLDSTNNNAALPNQFLYPHAGYTNIYYYDYDTNSSYHSLQASANKYLTHGLSGGLAWTWSKAMDYDDIDTSSLSNLVSPKVWNYGKAGYDRTHILKGSWVYQIPRATQRLAVGGFAKPMLSAVLDGWQLSGIMTLMSGAPLGVTLGTQTGNANNWSGSPTDAARPNVVANPVLSKDLRTFGMNLNPDAFSLPAQGTLGNAPKDVFRGPGRNNFDTSIFKNFKLTEKLRGQFRAEAYNVFNHTQFTSVDTTVRFDNRVGATYGQRVTAGSTFGQFTGAGLARRMQLAVRVDF